MKLHPKYANCNSAQEQQLTCRCAGLIYIEIICALQPCIINKQHNQFKTELGITGAWTLFKFSSSKDLKKYTLQIVIKYASSCTVVVVHNRDRLCIFGKPNTTHLSTIETHFLNHKRNLTSIFQLSRPISKLQMNRNRQKFFF